MTTAPLAHPLPLKAIARRAGKIRWRAEVIARALERGQHVHVVEVGGSLSCPGGQCTPEALQRRGA